MKRKSSNKKIAKVFVLPLIALLVIFLIDYSTTVVKRIYPVKYLDEIIKYSRKYDVDPYLVLAVIKAESSFKPTAISHKGAVGLMQITESTALWGASEAGLDSFKLEDLYDPETNIRLGCWYLRKLFDEFDGKMQLAVAAYNGGSGNVKKWLQNSDYSNNGKDLDKIPFRETELFVKRVKRYKTIYSRLYRGIATGRGEIYEY